MSLFGDFEYHTTFKYIMLAFFNIPTLGDVSQKWTCTNPHPTIMAAEEFTEDKQRPDNKYVVMAHQYAKRISKDLARVTQPEVACHLTREAWRLGGDFGGPFEGDWMER